MKRRKVRRIVKIVLLLILTFGLAIHYIWYTNDLKIRKEYYETLIESRW